jgi:hypothetical protein
MEIGVLEIMDLTIIDYFRGLVAVSWRLVLLFWIVSSVAVGLLLLYALLTYPKPPAQRSEGDDERVG